MHPSPRHRLVLVAAALTLPAAACAQTEDPQNSPAPPERADAAFVGVNVVPMATEEILEDRTVLVADGRISWIGPSDAAVPEGTERIDAAGMYLMPGLAEMHAHVPPQPGQDVLTDQILFLFIANGVTTIRGMLGAPHHLPLREALNSGEKLGPRLVTTGPSLNGNSVPTPASARQAVEAQAEAGYDLLKIHPGIGAETFDTLAATANRLGIPFAGHVPADVGLDRFLEAGPSTIDHVDGYLNALVGPDAPQLNFFGVNAMPYVDDSDSAIQALVDRTAAAGVAQVPTQSLFEDLLFDGGDLDAMYARDDVKYAWPSFRQSWANAVGQIRGTTPEEQMREFVDLRRRLILALHEAGVPILLGSDAPQIFNVPGYAMHEELETLVAAGLSPFEALRTGTVNVAEHLGASDRGTVEEGMAADLILLRANPLEAVGNVRQVEGVMIQGRWVDRAEIDAGLAEIEEANRSDSAETQ